MTLCSICYLVLVPKRSYTEPKKQHKIFANILRLSMLNNNKIIKSSKNLRSHGEIRIQEIAYLKLKT